MRRPGHSLLPDFQQLWDMLPAMGTLRPFDQHAIRVEDRVEQNRYLLRAELPGIDVDKDLDITVSNGLLTIAAQRSEEQAEKDRSEFRYGSFTRTVALPDNAKEDTIEADYTNGILTVSVELGESEEQVKQVRVRRG